MVYIPLNYFKYILFNLYSIKSQYSPEGCCKVKTLRCSSIQVRYIIFQGISAVLIPVGDAHWKSARRRPGQMMNGESLGVEQRLLCTGLFGCRLRWFTHQGFRHLIWPGNTSGSLRRSFWGEGHLEYGWMDGWMACRWMMGGWMDG